MLRSNISNNYNNNPSPNNSSPLGGLSARRQYPLPSFRTKEAATRKTTKQKETRTTTQQPSPTNITIRTKKKKLNGKDIIDL